MTVNRQVPCQPYIEHDELAPCCEGIEVGGDPATTLNSRYLASEFLYYRTAMQYPGPCSETIRPCYTCAPCGNPEDIVPPFTPVIYEGRILNIKCQGGACTCSDASFVELPDSPIISVDEVMIDGAVLDPSLYSLYNDTLYRVGGGSWPYCNELYLPTTESGTWSVTYQFGHAVPLLLKRAAIALACHWQAMCPSSDSCGACRIPRATVGMQRGNTSYQMMSPATVQTMTGNFWYTGIEEVDEAISTLNPDGHRRKARIYG